MLSAPSSAVCLLLFAASVIAAPLVKKMDATLELATFDGAKGTTFKWTAQNDPVMVTAHTPIL